MNNSRRKVLLPVFQLSKLASDNEQDAIPRVIKQGKGHPALTYYYKHCSDESGENAGRYNLLPIVLDKNGAPWPWATLYILAHLEAQNNPVMTTYASRADHLGAFKEWMDDQEWGDQAMFDFPKFKLRRPTYRYHGYIQQQIKAGEITAATGKRRIATVIEFYRWMISNKYFQPPHPPWEERRRLIHSRVPDGRAVSKEISSTDLSIRTSGSPDPYSETIQDGGSLRPLTTSEQNWVLEAAEAKRNTECYLIQLFMLATGARIQTVCTLRFRHFELFEPGYSRAPDGHGEVYKLKAGPGTGIDTKKEKNGLLQVPRSIYSLLHTYAISERASMRRARFFAKYGVHEDPYLFITQQGTPYYICRSDGMRFDPYKNRRYERLGQAIRQFITDHAIPYIRERYDKSFSYSVHDLRASFGMNMTEMLLGKVQEGSLTLLRARMIVRDLLWHESFSTTDDYLNYRSQVDMIRSAVNGYGEQLQRWAENSMKGLEPFNK